MPPENFADEKPFQRVDLKARIDPRLRSAAQRIRRRIPEFAGSLDPLPKRAAGEDCHHYLGQDRLQWWDKTPPESGQIKRPGNGLLDEVFLQQNEFCSSLATVVGSEFGTFSPDFPGYTVPWDTGTPPVGSSPNETPGIEFAIRGALPASTTTLTRLQLLIYGDLRDEVAVVLDQGGLQAAAPSRISLFIDFVVLQRAVVVEYGYAPADGLPDSIPGGAVQLLAFDRDGNLLPASASNSEMLEAKRLPHFLGARHSEGLIGTVELRLELPNNGQRDPKELPRLLVRRIWHEALPPAAVKQGTIAADINPLPPDVRGPHLPPLPDEYTHLPDDLTFPFHCDRAVVMMRGFRIEFLDEASRPINAIEVGLDAPSVFAKGRDPLTFQPFGTIGIGTPSPPGVRIYVYYLLVAWDSAQCEIFTAAPQGGYSTYTGEHSGADLQIVVPDPFPAELAAPSGDDPSTSRGNLFVGLRKFSFATPPVSSIPPAPAEIERIWLIAGQMGGGPCLVNPGDLYYTGFPIPDILIYLGQAIVGLTGYVLDTIVKFPDLARVNEQFFSGIQWSVCTEVTGAVFDPNRSVQGTLFTGRSLQLGGFPEPVGISVETYHKQRPPPDPAEMPTFFGPPGDTLPWPIEADMAFPAMGFFFFEPKGRIRELEVEVYGASYDGQTAQWTIGGGIVTETIGSGQPGRRVMILPMFAGITRNRQATAVVRLSIRPAVFTGVVGLLTFAPDHFGVMRNDSNVTIFLSGASVEGPNADEFLPQIDHRGTTLNWTELANHPPLPLEPGEEIVVGGLFYPQAAAGPDDPPRTAQLVTITSLSPRRPIRLTGRTRPSEAHGTLLPRVISFGQVQQVPAGDVPTPARRNALVTATGQTPLFVQFPQIEDATLGFSFFGFEPQPPEIQLGGVNGWQLDPGQSILFHLLFNPVRDGPVQTQLVVLTNDVDPNNQRLVATLNGEGI